MHQRSKPYLAGFLALVSLGVLLVSCKSLGLRNPFEDRSKSVKPKPTESVTEKKSSSAILPADRIVQRLGTTSPLLSKSTKKFWMNMASSEKDVFQKMYGSLVIGEWETAETMARKYLMDHPGDLAALNILAISLAFNKKFDLADYYADLLDELRPRDAESLNLKGLAAMTASKNRIEDYLQAVDYFRASFQSSKTQIAAGLNLGFLLLEIGNAKAALEAFEQVNDRVQDFFPSQLGKAIALVRLGVYDEAKPVLTALLDKSPNSGQVLYYLGLLNFYGTKNYKLADEYFKKIADNPHVESSILRDKAQNILLITEKKAEKPNKTP